MISKAGPLVLLYILCLQWKVKIIEIVNTRHLKIKRNTTRVQKSEQKIVCLPKVYTAHDKFLLRLLSDKHSIFCFNSACTDDSVYNRTRIAQCRFVKFLKFSGILENYREMMKCDLCSLVRPGIAKLWWNVPCAPNECYCGRCVDSGY